MSLIPPIPSWDAIHPMLVHFPIALLVVSLVPLFGALLLPRHARTLALTSFALMLAGTLGVFAAVSSGEAAGEAAESITRVEAVLEEHEELAETTRALFAGLTVLFALILFVPRLLRRSVTVPVRGVLYGVVFAVAAGSCAVLANTAHQGARLVHEFGVRAQIAPGAVADSTLIAGEDGPAGRAESKADDDRD